LLLKWKKNLLQKYLSTFESHKMRTISLMND
jgi:hypothetical protein